MGSLQKKQDPTKPIRSSIFMMAVRSIVMVVVLLIACSSSFVSKEEVKQVAPEKKSIEVQQSEVPDVQRTIGKIKAPQAPQKFNARKRAPIRDIDEWFRGKFGKAEKQARKMVHSKHPLIKKLQLQAIKKKWDNKGK